MSEQAKAKIESQGWYQQLIEDCKDIVVEGEFASRWMLIETYHALGKRVLEEKDNFERSKICGQEITKRISQSLERNRETVENATQFVHKYPDINTLPWGKNISWYKICNNLLSGPKDKGSEFGAMCPSWVLGHRTPYRRSRKH